MLLPAFALTVVAILSLYAMDCVHRQRMAQIKAQAEDHQPSLHGREQLAIELLAAHDEASEGLAND